MADNTVVNGASGGDTIATDDVGGIKFQRVKLVHGADGVNSGDISVTNPFPVGAAFRSDAIAESSATLLVPKWARFDFAASAEVIALVSAKKLRVVQLFASNGAATANLLTFKSNGTGGSIIWQAQLPAALGGGVSLWCPTGLFQTVAGENLYLTLSASTQVYGGLSYVEAA